MHASPHVLILQNKGRLSCHLAAHLETQEEDKAIGPTVHPPFPLFSQSFRTEMGACVKLCLQTIITVVSTHNSNHLCRIHSMEKAYFMNKCT
jgi:hypothetical protein